MRAFWLLALMGCGSSVTMGDADLSVPDLSPLPDLAGVDWYGVDFAGVDLTPEPLPDLSYRPDLTGLDLRGLDFSGLDLVAVPNIDLAAIDLGSASMFCAGTFVAGTCLQTFFLPLADCFKPSGACTQSGGGLTPVWCWPNSDELKQIAGGNTVERWYQNGSLTCFTKLIGGAGPGPAFSSGGQTL